MNVPRNTTKKHSSQADTSIILSVWKHQPKAATHFCIVIGRRELGAKSLSGPPRVIWFTRDRFGELADEVAKHVADKEVYAVPHGFTRPTRQGQYAAPTKCLYADMDTCDPRELVGLRPTMALQSSPGRFVGIWVLSDELPTDWGPLNQRLTYHLKDKDGRLADHGGWDPGQFLRMIPGCGNRKYETLPLVKRVWSQGPQYSGADLEKLLPAVAASKPLADVEDADTQDLWLRYARVLPNNMLVSLRSGRPDAANDRSKFLRSVTMTCAEKRVPFDHCFQMLKASAWNKFKTDDALTKEINRAYRKVEDRDAQNAPGAPSSASYIGGDVGELGRKTLKNTKEQPIPWIIPGLLCRREITIAEGDPGSAKSYFWQAMCFALADGKPNPLDPKQKFKRHVIVYFDLENSPEYVVMKRANGNGLVNGDNFIIVEEQLTMSMEDNRKRVHDLLEREKPDVILFDTLVGYIGGKTDTYKTEQVEEALNHFRYMAKTYDCAIVAIRHLTKGKGPAMYRGAGSITFQGKARISASYAHLVDDDHPAEEQWKAMKVNKYNLGLMPENALPYRIVPLPEDRSKLVWGEPIKMTADQLLAAAEEATTDSGGTKHDRAAAWLLEKLSDRWMTSAEVHKAFESSNAFSSSETLDRAAKALQENGQLRRCKTGSRTALWASISHLDRWLSKFFEEILTSGPINRDAAARMAEAKGLPRMWFAWQPLVENGTVAQTQRRDGHYYFSAPERPA